MARTRYLAAAALAVIGVVSLLIGEAMPVLLVGLLVLTVTTLLAVVTQLRTGRVHAGRT